MGIPQTQDHYVCSGEDYHFDLTFLDESGLPINLTGFEVSCKFYDCLRDVKATANVAIPDPTTGQVFFVFPERETRFLRGVLRCSARAIGATGNIQYAIDGDVFVRIIGDKPAPILISGQVDGVLSTVSGKVDTSIAGEIIGAVPVVDGGMV